MSRKHSRRATSAATATALLFACAGATAAIAIDRPNQPNATVASSRPLAAAPTAASTSAPGASFGVNGKVSTIPDPPTPTAKVNEAQARSGIMKACSAQPLRYGETRSLGNGEINFTPYSWGMKFTLSPKAAQQFQRDSRNRAGIGDFLNTFGLGQIPVLGQIFQIISSLIGAFGGGGSGGGMPDIGSIIGGLGGGSNGGSGNGDIIGGGSNGGSGIGDIIGGGSNGGSGIGDIPIPSPSDAGTVGGGVAPSDTDMPIAGGGSGSLPAATTSDALPSGTLVPGDGSGSLPGGAPTATPSDSSGGSSLPDVTIDPGAGGGTRVNKVGQYGLEINAPWLPFFAWQSTPTQPFQRAAQSCG